jgi:hypothetical protein
MRTYVDVGRWQNPGAFSHNRTEPHTARRGFPTRSDHTYLEHQGSARSPPSATTAPTQQPLRLWSRQCHCTTDVVVARFLQDGREPETASCPPCLCAGPTPARFECRDPFFLPVAWKQFLGHEPLRLHCCCERIIALGLVPRACRLRATTRSVQCPRWW